jgi:NifB/MoaA-like Fe-S oxidoreductase
VGLVRTFLRDLGTQARRFPDALPRRRLTLVTGELASGVLRTSVLPRLRAVHGLQVRLVVARNTLFGRSVTVAGLLSGKCLSLALEPIPRGDLVLLPPDILNADGLFLDDMTVEDLSAKVGTPIMVFDGRWMDVFARLLSPHRTARTALATGV